MDPVTKDLMSRKEEIIKELELLFKANMKITDWDVPEADDRRAAQILLEILREGVERIEADVRAGKYDRY